MYHFNENAAASVGVRYTANNDDGQSGTLNDTESLLGWGLAFTAGF